jgi:hypothetical protein
LRVVVLALPESPKPSPQVVLFMSIDTPPTATTSKMSEGKAKGQGD